MYNITGVRLDQGLQTTARGPNLARQDISLAHKDILLILKK